MFFETERLIVRNPIENDAIDIYNNYTQDSEVTKYLTWQPHTSAENAIDWINYCILNTENEKGIKLVIYHKNIKQAIGMLVFRYDGFKSDFGYVMSKNYWNQGIMTEAMKPVLDYVYKLPQIHRIWAIHDIDNEASGKAMLKLGLSFEGVIKKFIIHPNISSTPRDVKMYSLVK